ncbi:MAG: TrkA family potassium uptake protein [Chloroflexota bacterium]
MDSKKVVVVGCGRLGSTVASDLSANGHRVIVIDTRESSFDKLAQSYSGYKIVGDAVEYQTLAEADIDDADFLFAATTEDNTNLMVAQVAKKFFNIGTVVARVYDPHREVIYKDFGIKTISPTRLSSDVFQNIVS